MAPFFICDTFTADRFKGNPTAVCVLDSVLPDDNMHAIAKELQLPVTVFIEENKKADFYSIRYFTGTGEIPACGHATLAAAHVVQQLPATTAARFMTIEKRIIETRCDANIIYMTYPAYETVAVAENPELLSSLGLNSYTAMVLCPALGSLFIEVSDPNMIRNLQPDYNRLKKSSDSIKEVVVMAVSDDARYDFLLRSFCPWVGINEDPVTGSVHSVLAHFWKERLGKRKLIAWQASERGGEVYVNALDGRVEIGGAVVPVAEGMLEV